MKSIDYTRLLTDEDKIRIVFKKHRGKILHFVVQYYALINGRWCTIMRIDTCHGYPHKHTFYLNNEQYIMGLSESYEEALTKSETHIRNNYLKIKQNFLYGK